MIVTQYTESVEWTSQADHFFDCFKLHQLDVRDDKCEHTLDCLLVLTPLLERSLGNLLNTKKVPALLRDLLNEPDLENVLGSPCIIFMKLLLGSPRTLNIRNIVWHGFTLPGEI